MLTVIVAEEEGKTLEQVVESDLREFERWFMALGNDQLVRSEIAILKTYFAWKAKGTADGTQASR